MSTRPIIKPNILKPIINAADMSVNITGPATIIDNIPCISYDIKWTGTPTGTFQVQITNTVTLNPDGTVQNAGNWDTIPSTLFQGTYPVPSGSASTGKIDLFGTGFYAVRLTYTASSGAGTLTVVPAAKVW